MRSINSFINDFISAVKKSSALRDVKFIRVYPTNDKPTMLDETVVAVGIDKIELENESIGSETKHGSVSIFADIYVPVNKQSSKMTDILSSICSAVSSPCISGIKAGRIEYDNTARAYVLKSVFTFNDEIEFGGEL